MLNEGRKERLIAKYPTSEELLTDYLSNSDIHKKTNYKYADWYLTQYFEIGSMEDIPEIEDGDEILEKFDRYRKHLEKKDINQYETIGELADTISDYESKKPVKVSDDESVKLVDNEDIIVVRPLTHKSSCKYGSGTKWCTTHKDTKYFTQYDDKGNLYYIHNKQVESDNPFYKIAAFIKYTGDEEWYDALDKRMSDGEVKLAKLLIKKSALDLIKNDIQQTITSMKSETSNFRTEESMVNKVIETLEDRLDFSYEIEETSNSKYGYGSLPVWFEINSELGEVFGGTILETFMIGTSDPTKYQGVVLGQMRIDVNTERNEYKVSYQIDSTSGIFGDQDEEEKYPILRYVKEIHTYGMRGDDFNFNNWYETLIRFTKKLVNNPVTLKAITNKVFWSSNNVMSTYKFNRRGPLTNSMIKYLDGLGDKLGSKKDFLIKSGKVKEGKNGDLTSPSGEYLNIGGYFSTFFASLKDAGIIKYVREGRRFMITKGDNYEAFKEGNLRRV